MTDEPRRSLGLGGMLADWAIGDGAATGGQIATLVAGPGVRPGARDATPVNHCGVLRTIEDALHLPRLDRAADAANGSLNALFSTAPILR